MSTVLLDPFGSFLPALYLHDVRDRMHGAAARANARWGWLDPPPPGGRLIWIACGAQRLSLRLGIELARSIHAKRRNVRLLLTFEREQRELLASLAGLDRIAVGYAPADYGGSVRRAWRRAAPLGMVFCGALPRKNLAGACNSLRHVLAIDPPAVQPRLRVERAYPSSAAQAWPGRSAAPADFITLLVSDRVEPDFAQSINAGAERLLWWWHGDDLQHALRFIALFRGHLPQDVLFVSGAVADELARPAAGSVALSRWNRDYVEPGSIVVVDEPKWIPTVAAHAAGAHLASLERDLAWQAIAGGAVVSCDAPLSADFTPAEAVNACADEDAVLRGWREMRDDRAGTRERAQALRDRFHTERARAAEAAEELLQRICAWH